MDELWNSCRFWKRSLYGTRTSDKPEQFAFAEPGFVEKLLFHPQHRIHIHGCSIFPEARP
ncbi:MAG: hypothetical protein V9G29_15255 [Burkholderiaceae bacterium]